MLDAYSATNTALLEALRDEHDAAAWAEVVERLRPIVFAVTRRILDNDADAADAVQETFLSMLMEYRAGRFDRTRGRFHPWVRGIARHRAIDVLRKRARVPARGESALLEIPNESELEEIWSRECDLVVVRRAVELLRTRSGLTPTTVRVFERLTLEKCSPEEVAREAGLTVGAVYQARFRCRAFVRSVEPEIRRVLELD